MDRELRLTLRVTVSYVSPTRGGVISRLYVSQYRIEAVVAGVVARKAFVLAALAECVCCFIGAGVGSALL